jgi:hypothetical protein
MMKPLSRALALATCLFLFSPIANAQYKVHAMSGTVTVIHPKIQMTTLETDDGTSGSFEWLTKTGETVDFDKSVSADSTPADKFTTKGAQVIAFYFGSGSVRTLVALRDLGTTPLTKAMGIVLRFNKKAHQLTIMNMTGAEETFQLDAKTVTDTDTGVAVNFKYDFTKNEQVRVLATQTPGGEKALLIVPAY